MCAEIGEQDPTVSEDARVRELTRGALLRYYCVAHRTVAEGRSPVTIYQDSWAYCVSGDDEGHEWNPIEPISYTNLRSFGPTFLDRVNELAPASL